MEEHNQNISTPQTFKASFENSFVDVIKAARERDRLATQPLLTNRARPDRCAATFLLQARK